MFIFDDKKNLSIKLFFLFIFCTFISRNSLLADEIDFRASQSEIKAPEIAYLDCLKYFLEENFVDLIKNSEDLRKYHPFVSEIKFTTQLEVYALYQRDEYDKIISVVDFYIDRYNDDLDLFFMLYMKAVAYQSLAKDEKRNINYSTDSLNLFYILREKALKDKRYDYYLNSIKEYIDFLEDRIFLSNQEIADFYFDVGLTVAALKRYETILKDNSNILTKNEKELLLEKIYSILERVV